MIREKSDHGDREAVDRVDYDRTGHGLEIPRASVERGQLQEGCSRHDGP